MVDMFGRPTRRRLPRYYDTFTTVLAVIVATAVFVGVIMWALAQA